MKAKAKHALRELAPYAAIMAVPVLLFTFVLALARVDGRSMFPYLSDGDVMLCARHSGIGRGDVVIFRDAGGRILVKRVLGVAGDEVEVLGGVCTVNGEQEDPSYRNLADGTGPDFDLDMVPYGCLFVLGDNRGVSMDSRADGIGYVDLGQVVGRLVLRIGGAA